MTVLPANTGSSRYDLQMLLRKQQEASLERRSQDEDSKGEEMSKGSMQM